MKYQAIPANQLTLEQSDTWTRLLSAVPQCDSPYFRPEFTQTVSAVLPGCEVAVMEDGGQTVGFLPYHRTRRNVAEPVAPGLTDFQGAVVSPGVAWDVRELLRACRLSALYFDQALSTQTPLHGFFWRQAPAPFLDLAEGFDSYRQRRTEHSVTFQKTLRKVRRLEQEIGPLRLETQSTDRRLLATLIEWKTAQYLRTKTRNVFGVRWTVALLERLLDLRGPSLGGDLCALYAGDQLASVHMGMRSPGVLHWWFPVYNGDLARYSPGLILVVQVAAVVARQGVRRIDLGMGDEPFKVCLMSAASTVAGAAVDLRPLVRPCRRLWLQTRSFLQRSAWGQPARFLVHNARALFRRGPWGGYPS